MEGSEAIKNTLYQFSPSRSLNSDAIQSIKNAYLNEEEDYNLIGVDWSEMAADNNYLRSAGSTRDVGRNINDDCRATEPAPANLVQLRVA